MKRVIVHIDRLVLDGFARKDREGIASALQAELLRTLSDPAAGKRLARLGHVASVRADKIHVSADAKPQETGIGAARAITKGISR